MTLIYFETKKLLHKRLIMIVIAVALEIALGSLPSDHEHPYSPQVYRQYTEQLAGEYTPKKRELIFTRLDEVNNVIAEHEQLLEQYNADLIDLDEFAEHNKQYNKAIAEQQTLEYLAKKCESFDSLGSGEFFYDTDWYDLYSYRRYDLLSVLIMMLLIPPVFCNEYSSKMADILRTTKCGKTRLAVIKLSVSMFVMFWLSLIISTAELCTFAARYGLDSAFAPLQSIMGYEDYGKITVIGLFIRSSLMRAFSFAVCAAFICLISVYTKNMLFTFFLSFAACVFPALIAEGKVMSYAFSSSAHNGMYLPGMSVWMFCLICIVKCAGYGAMCVRKFGTIK